MHPLVSIIVPVYNKQNCIIQCLDSIKAQTYSDFEAIIIDDGSKDTSLELIQKYTAGDNRFRVKHISNGGVSNARNIGIEMARGEYLSFVDADDYLQPEFLEKLLRILREKENAQIAVASFYRVTDGNRIPQNSTTDFFEKQEIHVFREYDYDKDFVFRHVWGALFHRGLFEAVRFQRDICVGEDSLCMAQLIVQAPEIAIEKSCLYNYVINCESASHGKIDEKKSTVIEAWTKIISVYEKHPDCSKKFLTGCYLAFFSELVQNLRMMWQNQKPEMRGPLYQKYVDAARRLLRLFLQSEVSWKMKIAVSLFAVSPKMFFMFGF